MSMSNYSNAQLMRVPLGSISSAETKKLMRLAKKYVLRRAWLVDPTGVAEDGTNFIKVQVKHGSDVVAEHSTETGNEGALAAGTWSEMPETDITLESGEDLDLAVAIGGTGSLNAGSCALLELVEV